MDSGNKENVLRASENIANVSISSLNCTFGFNQSKLNPNDSLTYPEPPIQDSEVLETQMDNYERQINKLAHENIALRKKNKNLTNLARMKEEQLIEALEDIKKKKEEADAIMDEKYNNKLANYYDCFLQLENEKNYFEKKNDQLQEELEELKDKLENLEVESSQRVKNTPKEEPLPENEELKKISMEHVDAELNQAQSLAENVIEERRKSEIPITKASKVEVDYQAENETLKQRIEELEVEKKMHETKHANIEAALARWIFKACDDNTELNKYKEKSIKLEKENAKYLEDIEQLRVDRDSSLKLFKLNQVNLDENKTILSEKLSELERLSTHITQLEVDNHSLNDKIASLTNKVLFEAETQTACVSMHDAYCQTLTVESEPVKNASSSKLNDINSTGIVANIAAKFNGKANISPIASNPNADGIDAAGLHNELKSVKVKNDHLILEKISLKAKNDELKSENDELRCKLDELNKESAELATFITNSIEKNNHLLEKPPPSPVLTRGPKPPVVKDMASSGVQTSQSRLVNEKHAITTQTSSTTVATVHNTEVLWQSRIDACRKEMDAEMSGLKEKLSNQINDLKSKCTKLEAEIKEEKANISKLNILNKEISFNLSNKNEEYLQLEHAMEEKMIDFKKKKQIADTIIQQQKKLLDHIQNSTGNSKTVPADNQVKKTKFKGSKKNPLLAHLNKPAVPYKFSHQMSVTSQASSASSESIKSMSTHSIEAELNSNYMAYTELNRIRKPPDMVPPPPQQLQKQQQPPPTQQAVAKPFVPRVEPKRDIHVFITGLNTFPVYCHVCQHLIPIIAYASKCQICSFTCHSQCSNLNKHSKSLNNTSMNDDLFKYCQVNYMKTSTAYNDYVNKLIKTSVDTQVQLNKSQNHLLADYLHMYVDGKWKKLWVMLRVDGQLDLYQTRTNHKSFDNMNLINDRVKFETDYNIIKKLLANYASQLSVTTTSISSATSGAYKSEDSVNLYEQVDQSQPRTDFTTSLVILLYTQKNCTQLGFDTFSKKIIWLDALQSSCLINTIPPGMPSSNSSGSISKKLALSVPGNNSNRFKPFNLERALNPFLELSDFLSVNSFCFINERLIALACDDGLYVSEPGAPSINGAPSLSLVKINTIESAHKLNHEFGKLCLIGRRSRQFLAIDINDLLTAKVIHKNPNDESTENGSDDEEDEKLINVKIEHIHSIDRCHLFESSLSSAGNWYSAVATPETIFILLFNQTASKFNLIKTINTQQDSPCLCLKFSQKTNQLIYGCTKEFYKMDLTYLQPTPIVENLVSSGKKILNDEDLLVSSKKKQPISVCVIRLNDQVENEAVLLCYEDYALILSYNTVTQNWQLQQSQAPVTSKKTNSSTSIGTSSSSSAGNLACLKWPRGLPPLQIEYDAPNLFLFYNDSIIVYKIHFEEGMFMFKKSGIAFIYKPRFLSTLHLSNANCIIISNRRVNTAAASVSEGSDVSEITNNRNVYNEYGTENDYSNDDELDDIKSSSKINFEDEDRICLSHFSPYDE